MQPTSSSTAILLFTRTAEEEAQSKTFVAGLGRKSQQLMARRFIQHTRAVASRTSLPVFVIDSDQQAGEHFGERFAHAFSSVFALGFKHVIAIGNDTLSLTSDNLTHTAELLQNEQAVIGPTTRGGAYVVGLSRKHFDARAFSELAWESEKLAKQLADYASRRAVDVVFLVQKTDINTPSDLRIALKRLPSYTKIYLILRSVIASSHPLKLILSISSTLATEQCILQLRGPPVSTVKCAAL